MPSNRRMKTFGVIILLSVLVVLYLTSGARQTRESDFYTRTADALNARRKNDERKPGVIKDDEIGRRLRDAESRAKDDAEKRVNQFIETEKGRNEHAVGAGQAALKDDEESHGPPTAATRAPGSPAASVVDAITGEGLDIGQKGKGMKADGAAHDEGPEKSIAGRVKVKTEGAKEKVDGVAKVGNMGSNKDRGETQSDRQKEVNAELNDILKKSPSK